MHITLPKNPQYYQTIFLMIILNLGISAYGLYFDYKKFFLVFWTCLILDALFLRWQSGKWWYPYSWLNAGFGISFFLRTDILWLYVLAAFLAISSKYLFRIQNRHFFNPSNFGVFLTLALFPLLTWTNPLQWWIFLWNTIWFPFISWLILVLWLSVVWRVYVWKKINLLWLIIPFVATHIFLYIFTTNEGFGPSFLKWYTPSFLIFTFFMITDPQTVLENRFSRMIYGSSVAIGVYILQFFINENYSTLASLFFLSMFLPIIRWLDMYILYKNITYWNVIMIFSLFSAFILYLYCVYLYGYPDLVFENRCRQLFCY